MQRVTASQVSFSNVIGEPGHTKPQAARLRHGVSCSGCFGCALLSTLIERLPTLRIKGSLTFQPPRLQSVEFECLCCWPQLMKRHLQSTNAVEAVVRSLVSQCRPQRF